VRHGLNSRNWASALNCDGRYRLGLLAACALLLIPQLGGSAATNLLRYDRGSIAAGQWWRLLTAHIAHLGLHHALLNTLGLVFLWALFAREWKPLQWAVIVLVVTVAIDSGLWFRDPGITWYVGASGVLHGLMAAGVVAYVRRRDPLGWIMAGLLAAKLAYEHIQGPLPFAGRGVPVVVDAHLYGVLGGLVSSIFLARRRPRDSQKPKPPVRQTPERGSTAPQT
jgi:rhomboid family GlyGly-CTERM serine protease